jgi:hypothetical protein
MEAPLLSVTIPEMSALEVWDVTAGTMRIPVNNTETTLDIEPSC